MSDIPYHDYPSDRQYRLFEEVLGGGPDEKPEYIQLLELVEYADLTPAEALDYFVCEVDEDGLTQTAWADCRGVDQSTVSENIGKAKKKLNE